MCAGRPAAPLARAARSCDVALGERSLPRRDLDHRRAVLRAAGRPDRERGAHRRDERERERRSRRSCAAPRGANGRKLRRQRLITTHHQLGVHAAHEVARHVAEEARSGPGVVDAQLATAPGAPGSSAPTSRLQRLLVDRHAVGAQRQRARRRRTTISSCASGPCCRTWKTTWPAGTALRRRDDREVALGDVERRRPPVAQADVRHSPQPRRPRASSGDRAQAARPRSASSRAIAPYRDSGRGA